MRTVGTVSLPAISQNNLVQVTQTITLPDQPRGFPGDGSKFYVSFSLNPGTNPKNNAVGSPVQITAPYPELVVTSLDVPSVMQPGDTIAPSIRIANIGPGDTAAQGPVTVALVASTTPRFNAGVSRIATYTVTDIPSIASVSTGGTLVGDININPQANVVTINGSPVTLPTSPRNYYIGVVVDPNNTIHQIHSISGNASRVLQQVHKVGPPIPGLLPAGVNVTAPSNQPFPYPAAVQ